MATLQLDENNSTYQINAYQPGQIRINEKVFTKSVIVAPETLIENWSPQYVEELNIETLTPVLALKPDILLIGTGSHFVLLDVRIYGELINHGIGVEIMDTHAACRTFNALSAEKRHVVAALIIQ